MEITGFNFEAMPHIPEATIPPIVQMKPTNNFGYINTLLERIIQGKDPQVDRFNEVGSRKSGKTESWSIGTM